MVVFILFIFLLSAIIVIHEFGHLLAAKFFGVYCSEFAIGMGPEVAHIMGKETKYALRLFPLGGFVAMAGDSDNALESKTEAEVPPERTLLGIAGWKKIVIMLAGIIMNFLLALIISAIVLLNIGTYPKPVPPIIKEVSVGLPAAEVGLQAGDRIIELRYDDLDLTYAPQTFEDLGNFLYGHEKEELTIVVKRAEAVLEFNLKPQYDAAEERYLIGIMAAKPELAKVNLTNCLYYAAAYLSNVTRAVLMSLKQLLRGIGLKNLSGPVGVYHATAEAIAYGTNSYLLIMAVLSLNIGIFNALPLPILDGGRILITLIEMVSGKPLSKKALSALMGASMLFLLALMVFVTYQDILKLFR